jgi:hypothetical protein
MRALLSNSSQFKLLAASIFVRSDRLLEESTTRRGLASRPAGAAAPDPIIMALHGRANTITPTLEQILEIRPPSHWGLNE